MNIVCGYLYRTKFPFEHIQKEYTKAEIFFSKQLNENGKQKD